MRLAVLQRGNALFDRRVRAEQLAQAAGNAHGLHALRQSARLHAAQTVQGVDHRLLAAHQLRSAGVGAELALAREPGNDDGGQETEHDVELERERLLAALAQLAGEQEIYRIKGFVALPAKPMRLVVHGVGKRFDSYFDRRWRDDEVRKTHLVFIGHDLDEAAIRADLNEAL